MSGTLAIQNRQRSHAVNVPQLRRATRKLLQDILRLEASELGVWIVDASEITRLNETFLHHQGSTDVITFDYADQAGHPSSLSSSIARTRHSASAVRPALHGEIFVCMDEVIANARRFGVAPHRELLRCVVHGVLHLSGFDDTRSASRRKMKREENRLLRKLVMRRATAKRRAHDS